MMHSSVTIQITPESMPSHPAFLGEVAVFARVLTHEGIWKAIQEQVRFARARFGRYEVIDFVAVLIGYVLSGEPTLLAFYDRLAPFAEPFMALFGRDLLPHRSTLSRFLAALDQAPVEALRALFHQDLLARNPFPTPGGLFDRQERQWVVIDVDGTSAHDPNLLFIPRSDLSRLAYAVCSPLYIVQSPEISVLKKSLLKLIRKKQERPSCS